MNGDSAQELKKLAANSVDSVVCDPPYGISFLGKDWDSKKATETTSKLVGLQRLPSGMKHTSLANDLEFQFWLKDIFAECLRVLKPGGYLLAFSAARTYHHMAMAAQTAGFEIRDQLMWIYSSGFPKSQDVGKSIQRSLGVKERKTRKSLNGYAKEQTTHGAQRVGDVSKDDYEKEITQTVCTDEEAKQWEGWGTSLKPAHEPVVMARKPVKGSIAKNVQEHGTGALNIDACRVGDFQPTQPSTGTNVIHRELEGADEKNATHTVPNTRGRFPSNVIGEVTGYQKYFYCPKVNRKERHCGFDLSSIPTQPEGKYDRSNDPGNGNERILNKGGNNHPTVKPVALMAYLIKLVTPPNGTVLDPFCGSGSTGMAAVQEGFKFIGCELDPNYVKIAETRIKAWANKNKPQTEFDSLFTTD